MVPTFKKVNAIVPASANAGAFSANVIDTQGYRYAVLEATFGAIGAQATALKVQEADAIASGTALTGGTDVPGTIVGTSANDEGTVLALPAAGQANFTYRFEIDLK